MIKIVNLLKSLQCLTTNAHLTFKKYELHLLANKINDGVDDLIDNLCDLYLAQTNDESIAYCLESQKEVVAILSKLPAQPIPQNQIWIEILNLLDIILVECSKEIQNQNSEGIINALGEVSEIITRNKYLVQNIIE
jgi:hypothetical protein